MVKSGYVLILSSGHVSGVIAKGDTERMQKRFGGRIVSAVGLPVARTAQGIRVLSEAGKAEARTR